MCSVGRVNRYIYCNKSTTYTVELCETLRKLFENPVILKINVVLYNNTFHLGAGCVTCTDFSDTREHVLCWFMRTQQ